MSKLKWLKAKCPYCGANYEYLPSYKPATCSKFDCVWKHNHPELYKQVTRLREEVMPNENNPIYKSE